MTHTLHRRGPRESLENDFVLFAIPAQGFNEKGSIPKLTKFFDIVTKYDPVNLGDCGTGNKYGVGEEGIRENITQSSVVHAVFTEKEVFQQAMQEVKEADLGISIIGTGILDAVDKLSREVGIERHTIEHSLGIWGDRDKLPEDEILEITTMCGHGMISTNLVKLVIGKVKDGKMTPEEAARQVSPNCHCGVFNPKRAAEIIERIVEGN